MSEDSEALDWRISTWSQMGNCVEVATCRSGVLLRNSRDRDGAYLEFTASEWAAFMAGAKAGEFDGSWSDSRITKDSEP